MKKMLKKSNIYLLSSLLVFCFAVIVLLSVLLVNNNGTISAVPAEKQVFAEQVEVPIQEDHVQISEPVLETFEEPEIKVESSKELIPKEEESFAVKSSPVPVGESSSKDGFVYANRTDFYINGMPFYFSGANNYYLRYANQDCVGYDINQGCQKEVLDDAQDMNLTVIRTWGFADGDYYWGSLQPSLGNYDEENFRKLDYLIKEASERSIKLILPFVNNWNEYGGICQYVKWCGNYSACDPNAGSGTSAEVHDSFYTNSCTKDAFKDYIAYVLNRTNYYTGIKYKDDPTIFAWELANEPRAKSDLTGNVMNNWIDEMSSYIKSIDSNHMVTTGAEGFSASSEGTNFISNHNHTNIDYASFHLYPDYWSMSYEDSVQWIEDHADDAHQVLGKPVVLGEFNKMGSSRESYLQGWYEAILNKSVNGNLIWELIDENYPWDTDFGIKYPEDILTSQIISSSANFFASVLPQISPSNNAPVFSPISDIAVTEGDTVSIEVNAYDLDGDFIFYSISDAGRFNRNGNTWEWDTFAGDEGTYEIEVFVSDGVETSKETLNVIVIGNSGCVVPYSGMVVSSNIELCSGTYEINETITIGSNSVLNCNGAELVGKGSPYALQASGSNIKIENCLLKDFSRGVQLIGADHIIIENNTFDYYLYHGISIQESNHIQILDNQFKYNYDIGLYAYQSSNIISSGNNFTGNGKGIYFDGCSDNTINDSFFESNKAGAVYLLAGSNNNLLSGNYLDSNGLSWSQGGGFRISNSNSNTLLNNILLDNYEGIYISWGGGHTLSNNKIDGNSKSFYIYSGDIDGYINNIDISNTINGKPIYYWIGESDKVFPSDAAFAGAVNSDNITIQNQVFTNFLGAVLVSSSNSRIENSTMGRVDFVGVNNSVIGRSSFREIGMLGSNNNNISKNSIISGSYGLKLESSHKNIISENIIKNSYNSGIDLKYSTLNLISNNYIDKCTYIYSCKGISLLASSNNVILANNITHNKEGVYISYSSVNLTNNNIYDNEVRNVRTYGGPEHNSTANNNWWGSSECGYIESQITVNPNTLGEVPYLNYSIVLDAPFPEGQPGSCVNSICSQDSDCGTDGFIDSSFCNGDNVFQTYRTFTCENPGDEYSYCSYSDEDQSIEHCSDNCYEGECTSIECFVDSDCDESGWLGLGYCFENNVWDVFSNNSCVNPGTPESSCVSNMLTLEREVCLGVCIDSSCDNDADDDGFDFDEDCNDTNPYINPDEEETCNLIDDNCNGDIDENACPDLSIYHYSLLDPEEPFAGDDLVFKVEVRNTGYSEAENIEWMMDTNSSDQNEESGGFSLGVMESIWIYPEFSYAISGNYSPKFVLDYEDKIIEDDETNNEVVIPISVGGN